MSEPDGTVNYDLAHDAVTQTDQQEQERAARVLTCEGQLQILDLFVEGDELWVLASRQCTRQERIDLVKKLVCEVFDEKNICIISPKTECGEALMKKHLLRKAANVCITEISALVARAQ